MLKKNSKCEDCGMPYKIVWNCKINSFEKDWLFLCYNCILLHKNLNGVYFKTQLQNIKSFRWCRLKLSKIELPFFEFFTTSKNLKLY